LAVTRKAGHLPRHCDTLQGPQHLHGPIPMNEYYYDKIVLDDHDIREGAYKRCFGGEAKQWWLRGLFQLRLLQARGLRRDSRLFDVGCGPLRGGVHFIHFLEPGNYCGIDSNISFIKAARHIVAHNNDLKDRSPVLDVSGNFLPPKTVTARFDFGIAFSVLNHCTEAQRAQFFANAPAVFHQRSRIILTHSANWFHKSYLEDSHLEVAEVFEESSFYGWGVTGEIFPILELRLR